MISDTFKFYVTVFPLFPQVTKSRAVSEKPRLELEQQFAPSRCAEAAVDEFLQIDMEKPLSPS